MRSHGYASTWRRLIPGHLLVDADWLEPVEDLIARPDIRSRLRQHDLDRSYPRDVVEKLWSLGAGTAFDPDTANAAQIGALNELLARHSGSLAITIGVNGLALLPVYLRATPAQRDLVRVRQADGVLAGLLLTEWSHGSNLSRNTATATAIGPATGGDPSVGAAHRYRVAGEKHLINGGTEHDLLVTLLRLGQEDGPSTAEELFALFLIDRDDTVRPLPGWATLPVPAADISGVRFEGTLVPAERMIGAPGEGLEIIAQTLALSRGGIGALASGAVGGALAEALGYASTRDVYGGPIIGLGAIAEHLVRMRALDLLVSATSVKATVLSNAMGTAATHFTAVAKYACCALAEAAVGEGRAVLGARALLEETHYTGFVRDVLLYGVFDGTSHVILDQLRWRLRRFAAAAEAPAEPVARLADAYAAAPRALVDLARRRSRPYLPPIAARCAGLATASGSARVRDLHRLVSELCAVCARVPADADDQAWWFAAATILAEAEALLAACELVDPDCRRALGLTGVHPEDLEGALDYALGWRCPELLGRLESLADDLGAPVTSPPGGTGADDAAADPVTSGRAAAGWTAARRRGRRALTGVGPGSHAERSSTEGLPS